MTWKKKLPDSPRTTYAPRAIAKDLRVDVEVVMEALREIGEYADSPTRRSIEEPVRRRLLAHLGFEYEAPRVESVSQWERQGYSTPTPVKGANSRERPDPKLPTSFSSKDHSVGLGMRTDDVAPAWEDQSWKLLGFTDVERDAWLVYLRRGQAKLAATYRDAGLAPDDMPVDVMGWQIYKRLRSGESPREVLRLLKRAREAG